MSGTTTTITISLNETSARKVFSHVLSHPHADVSGALLCGAVSSSSSQNNNNNNREIVDAMPLFHCESIDCAAMNEIALTQVQKYAKTREMRICGVYFASGNFNTNTNSNVNSERSSDSSGDLLPDRAKGLADAIGKAASSEGGGGGEVDEVQCLLLDAGKLKPFLDATLDSKNDEQTTAVVAAPFRVFSGSNYSNNGGELKRRANAVVRCCSNALPSSSERRQPVYDFDDHFDDIGKDWRNNTKEA